MTGRRWLAAAAMLALTLMTMAPGRADPLAIRVGWVQTPGHMAPLVEALGKKHPELFKHLGKSYEIQAMRFAGTTPQIQAQAIKDLEIASQSPSALALAITNAHLDLRAVADVVGDGRDGYFSEDFVVLADGPIKPVDDVKGKRIATNAIGSASDEAMPASMFHHHGAQRRRFHHRRGQFHQHAGDAGRRKGRPDRGLAAIRRRHGIGNPKYKVLFRAVDAVGPSQAVMWAIRADTIAEHRPQLVDFFEDYIRAVRWYIDPKNRDEALAIASDVTKLPKERLAFAFTKQGFYHSPDLRPDIALAQKEISRVGRARRDLPKPVELSPKYDRPVADREGEKQRIDGEAEDDFHHEDTKRSRPRRCQTCWWLLPIHFFPRHSPICVSASCVIRVADELQS